MVVRRCIDDFVREVCGRASGRALACKPLKARELLGVWRPPTFSFMASDTLPSATLFGVVFSFIVTRYSGRSE